MTLLENASIEIEETVYSTVKKSSTFRGYEFDEINLVAITDNEKTVWGIGSVEVELHGNRSECLRKLKNYEFDTDIYECDYKTYEKFAQAKAAFDMLNSVTHSDNIAKLQP